MAALKKTLSYCLRIGISVILLALLLRRIDAGATLEVILGSNLVLVLAAFLISLIGYIFCFFRWKMLLDALNVRVSTGRLASVYSAGIFFGAFFPATVGQDVVRSLDLSHQTKNSSAVVAAVLLDRISGFTGMILMALAALAVSFTVGYHLPIVVSIGVLTLLLCVVLLAVFNSRCYEAIQRLLGAPGAGRIRKSLEAVHTQMRCIRGFRGLLVRNVSLSLLIQALGPVCGVIICYALGFQVPVLYFFLTVPVITAVTLIPVSIAGLGTRDVSMVYFLSLFGIGREAAFAISLLSFGFIAATACLAGLVYVATLHHRRV